MSKEDKSFIAIFFSGGFLVFLLSSLWAAPEAKNNIHSIFFLFLVFGSVRLIHDIVEDSGAPKWLSMPFEAFVVVVLGFGAGEVIRNMF
jgi:hypothetical protein